MPGDRSGNGLDALFRDFSVCMFGNTQQTHGRNIHALGKRAENAIKQIAADIVLAVRRRIRFKPDLVQRLDHSCCRGRGTGNARALLHGGTVGFQSPVLCPYLNTELTRCPVSSDEQQTSAVCIGEVTSECLDKIRRPGRWNGDRSRAGRIPELTRQVFGQTPLIGPDFAGADDNAWPAILSDLGVDIKHGVRASRDSSMTVGGPCRHADSLVKLKVFQPVKPIVRVSRDPPQQHPEA